ncbi:MAG: carbohydrate ABC transporter permease [Ignavibacteria bacterium]
MKLTKIFLSRRKKDNVAGYIFLIIPLLINSVFLFYPIIYSFILSLFDWNLLMPEKYFIGFSNFKELFTDKVFLISIKNTFIYTAGVVPLQTIVALLMAVLLNQKVRGRPFFRTAFYIPSITSSVVTSVIFMWIYAKPGLLNYLLSLMGISGPDWLASTDFALSSIMILNIWSTAGYFMITFLAALQNIPESLYESARVDGANKFRMFWNVTVPMVRPAIFFVVTLGMIGCFQVFDQIYVMSSGGPANATTTMSYFIYQNAFKYFRMGYASAASVVLFLFILSFTLIQKKYYKIQF